MDISEHYKTEQEIKDELTELYGTVKVAYCEVDAGRFLYDYDRPFFDAYLAESLQWECGECGTLYDEEDKQEAEECCQEDDEDLDEEDEE